MESLRSNKISSFVALFLAVLMLVACNGKGGEKQKVQEIESEVIEQPKDTIAPTIIAYSRSLNIGEDVDLLKDVTATREGKSVKVEVESSELDVQKEGDYLVTYKATSEGGAVGKKTVTFHVKNPKHKVIYLTFDDGPSNLTGKVLEILRENEVHATFFVTGNHQSYTKYMRQAFKEGNAIAAHTYCHDYSIYKSFDTFFDDLDKIEAVIEKEIGQRTPIIRFPGGSSNHVFAKYNSDPEFMMKLTDEVQKRGYQYFDWNLSNHDASANLVDVETIKAKACRASQNEIYLLMHDSPAKTTTVEALPTIIQYFKEKGYEFATIQSTGAICHHDISPFPKIKQKLHADSTTLVTPSTTTATEGAEQQSEDMTTL